jgi:hypothetical protein
MECRRGGPAYSGLMFAKLTTLLHWFGFKGDKPAEVLGEAALWRPSRQTAPSSWDRRDRR